MTLTYRLLHGDVREKLTELPDQCVQTCVTSPPYWGAQRDYAVPGQMGMEKEPREFTAGIVAVFAEVRRVLADDGCVWLNMGDSYAASGKGGGGSMMRRRHESWSHRGIELNAAYIELERKRIGAVAPLFAREIA